MVRGFEGWALPCGCCSALGEQRRKWTSPREVRGRRGQLGAEAMGTEEGQGPLGSCTRGLWSLGWVQSEAGTSRDQPSPEPEAASLLTAQEGPSFLPVLFPWKSLVTGLCGASGTGREDLLPQREDQGDGSVVIPPPRPTQICRTQAGQALCPSSPLPSPASRTRAPQIRSLAPLPNTPSGPRASSPLTHR